jgi:rod shape determining protein RodA
MTRPGRAGVRASLGALDWSLGGRGLLLSVVSLVAPRRATATLDPGLAMKQAMWLGLGMVLSAAVACVPYGRWIDLGVLCYPLAVAGLLFVLVAGTTKLGASRWITIFGISLQPSELAKLAAACVVARSLGSHAPPVGLRPIALAGALAGLPALLVFVQPDLGTASIFGAIWLGAAFVAGVSRRALAGLAVALAALGPCGWFLLKEYQRQRLTVFLNPNADPLGAGYTIIQSKITIGAGQLFGRGWMSGTQSQLSFLPERHTDFLYSVVGEEWGFVGSVTVVALFAILLRRMLAAARDNSEAQGRTLAVALACWLGYQAIVNMGMVMGVLPVVGIPLPMVSYGGTAMLASWIALGLLQSIRRFGTRC